VARLTTKGFLPNCQLARSQRARGTDHRPTQTKAPALFGTATGAKIERLSGHKESTEALDPTQGRAVSTISVYDGARCVGRLVERDAHRHEAFDSAGALVGTFRTRTAAMRAVPPSYSNKEDNTALAR